jgi:molybdenum cofactor cytidylyltransferase
MNAAIILAAGESSRLGHPKQLVAIDGEPLVERTARIAREAGLVPYVVVGAYADEVSAVVGSGKIVRNSRWDEGITTSIVAGLERAVADEALTVTIVPCDLPGLTARDLERLLEGVQEAPIAAAAYERVVGAPATFSKICFDALRSLPDGEGARSLLRSGRWEVTEVAIPAAALDIDTEEDLEALR